MAARAISSGTVSFGLVSIPVKLFTATSSKSVHFNMLHEKDKSRLKQQYISANTGDVVPRGEMVRGYEYARGQFVVLSDEELKGLQTKADQMISIEEFIPIEKVDPIFFDKPYLLGPDKGGHKPYRLLREAMMKSGKVAVGRHGTRGKQQLVLLRPVQEGLVLHGLHYSDEVRGFDDIDLGDPIELKDEEINLANQLIDQLTHKAFKPDQYEDEYRVKVLEAIEKKVAGEEIVIMPQSEPQEQIIDLVSALKKSLEERPDSAREPRRKTAPKKRKAAAK